MEVGEILRKEVEDYPGLPWGTWQAWRRPRMRANCGMANVRGPGGRRLGLCFDPLTQSSVYRWGSCCVLRAPSSSCS